MVAYVYRDGSRLTPHMLYQVNRADVDFFRRFGCHILVSSGIRTNAEQTEIFLSKYRVQVFGSGPYGDVRWWKGRRYVRVVGGGTVAAPGKSNHEIQGSKAAVDLRDSGSDAGVAKGGNPRANWLKANAHKYGLVPEGYGFGEPWHYAVLNIYNSVPGSGASTGSGSGSSGGKPTPPPTTPIDEDEDDMYIANVKNGNFYLVIGKQAHALGANSGARESKIPIINYPDDWSVAKLKTVVSGIG